MPKYMVSYDLIKYKDYPRLWDELERLGAKKILFSQWGVNMVAGTTATVLRDHFKTFVDEDDRIVVVQLDGTDKASWNALTKLADI